MLTKIKLMKIVIKMHQQRIVMTVQITKEEKGITPTLITVLMITIMSRRSNDATTLVRGLRHLSKCAGDCEDTAGTSTGVDNGVYGD